RRPQLAQLQAALNDALARLAQARLNLERTTITAPFNGVLTHKTVDIGAKVGEATTLATIVGTDSFWLKLTLPVEQLQWLDIPQRNGESGARVTIYPQGSVTADRTRSGEIVRLVSDLEEKGRMAQLLVRVEDPLCLNKENKEKPKLLLGSYVRAEIHGTTIDSGYTIARTNLRDNNTVWLMDDQGKLDIRPVEVAYRGHQKVTVTGGIDEGERLVVTALSSPVMGTPLRTSEESAPQRQVTAQEDTDSTRVKHVN
ncbi:MAG TPA: HlyD family efflux transporter periplasmic adaptor subunit, partial [Desulfopila sp.]|nr:HlyD family efflux transporter periplasmic adaptor subunit [Desulfopila sp.]